MSDVAITWNTSQMEGVINFSSSTNDLDTDDGLYTAVLISLFTDARASDDDPLPADVFPEDFSDRKGWWGDSTSERDNDSVGSKLWLLERAKVTNENLRKAKGYVEEALQWMLDEGIAAKINVEVAAQKNSPREVLAIAIDILRSTGTAVSFRFEDAWENSVYLPTVIQSVPAPPEPTPTDLQFLGVGHSYVKGTYSGQGVTDNSYRREMYYRWRTDYGMEFTFVGSQTGGDIPTPYHNGVAAEDSAGLDAAIDGYLDLAFVVPTTSDCVLLGPIGFADCLNSVPLATFNTNVTSIINKIHAHSPLIKIFVVTDPDVPNYTGFPPLQDINDYAAEMVTVYNTALAAGNNVYLLDVNSQTIHIPSPGDPAGGDDVHPDWLGYEQMGEYMTDQIATQLSISAVSEETLLQDSFTDTNGVLLKNHTPDVNETGNVWVDASDRFEINTNQAHGIGGYAFDTRFDIGQVIFKGQIKMYQSISGSCFFLLKTNAAGTSYIYLWMNSGTNELAINANGGLYTKDVFVNATSTWYTFKINIRGNSIRIADGSDVELLHVFLNGTYDNYTHLGLSYFPPSDSRFDDLLVNKLLA